MLVECGWVVVVVLLGGGGAVVVVVEGAVVDDVGGLVVGVVVLVGGSSVVVVVEPRAVVVVVVVVAGGVLGPTGCWRDVVVGEGVCTTEISCGGDAATIGLRLNAPFGDRAMAASPGEFVVGNATAPARLTRPPGTAVVVVVESPEGAVVLLGGSIPVRPTPDAEDKPQTSKATKTTAAPRAPASWSRGRRRTQWIMDGFCRLLYSQETFAQENAIGPRLAGDASRFAIRAKSPHVRR
ncbi:MAG TPA: hypothetical protein VF942_17305 [Acidimicrobiales bacterium]